MSKSEAKREHILCRGLQVMQAHGYNGTSVKDIVDAAEVPKGSFYNYFDSKEAFALDAIDKVSTETFQEMSRVLGNTHTSAKERLAAFFSSSFNICCEQEFKIGCFLGNMCQEMADSSDAIRRKINTSLERLTGLVETTLRQSQKDGELDGGYDPKVLAEFLMNAWEGALMRVKASACREPLDAFEAQLDIVFQSKVIKQI